VTLGPRARLGALCALALLAFAAFTLWREPCLGVADNGDWWRVMRPAGIDHEVAPRRPGGFVHCELTLFDGDLATGLSSPALVAWASKDLRPVFAASPGRFDLRQIGVLYLFLVAVLVAWALAGGAGRRVSPWLVAGWCYVLFDPGYLLFFNSFYADPALLVAVFGLSIWLVKDGGVATPEQEATAAAETDGSRSVGIAVSIAIGTALASLGGGSKMQYVLLPAAALFAVASLGWTSRPPASAPLHRSRAVAIVLASLVILALALPWHFFHGPAPRFLSVNNYHAVFAGLLQVTGEPERALRELGVPEEHADLPRRDVWSGRVPLDHPVHASLTDLSRVHLLALYLREPSAVGATVVRIDGALAGRVPHQRGTYAREAGRRRWAQYEVRWGFSRLRAAFSWLRPWWLAALLALAGLLWRLARDRSAWAGRHAAALFLLLFTGSSAVVAVLGDGFVALDQHLLGTRFALDLLLVLVLHEAAGSFVSWSRRASSCG
jgi:hypothetical protein